jgi:hypothetical protein
MLSPLTPAPLPDGERGDGQADQLMRAARRAAVISAVVA